MHFTLHRTYDDGQQTKGILTLWDSAGNRLLICQTLELSYKDNQRQISCIKTGTYIVQPHFSFRHGKTFKLLNVPERDNILIHSGNFNSDTKGCILVGNGWSDINEDGILDLLNSRITMKLILAILKTGTTIKIINEWNP